MSCFDDSIKSGESTRNVKASKAYNTRGLFSEIEFAIRKYRISLTVVQTVSAMDN